MNLFKEIKLFVKMDVILKNMIILIKDHNAFVKVKNLNQILIQLQI